MYHDYFLFIYIMWFCKICGIAFVHFPTSHALPPMPYLPCPTCQCKHKNISSLNIFQMTYDYNFGLIAFFNIFLYNKVSGRRMRTFIFIYKNKSARATSRYLIILYIACTGKLRPTTFAIRWTISQTNPIFL